VLRIDNLSLRYPNGKLALAGVSLSVGPGELVVVLGSNGSGKSTLLRCITRILKPDSGAIWVADEDFAALAGERLRHARTKLAMICQNANLVRRRSVIANVASGALGRYPDIFTALGRLPPAEIAPARRYLAEVGLAEICWQRAGTLSGGQAQRVAVARALAQRPRVLLADEPIASLDPEAAEDIMKLLRRLASEENLAVLCVLHQPELALRYADRVVGMRDGRIAFDSPASDVPLDLVRALYLLEAA
jgi:phosphonate transport system ATP-binding protein